MFIFQIEVYYECFYFQDYRGIVDDTRVSNNTANQAMIRRFNQHSTLVLRAGTNEAHDDPPDGSDESKKSKKGKSKSEVKDVNSVNGHVANGVANGITDVIEEPLKKKVGL